MHYRALSSSYYFFLSESCCCFILLKKYLLLFLLESVKKNYSGKKVFFECGISVRAAFFSLWVRCTVRTVRVRSALEHCVRAVDRYSRYTKREWNPAELSLGLVGYFEYSEKRPDIFCYFYFEIVHRHTYTNKPAKPSDSWISFLFLYICYL